MNGKFSRSRVVDSVQAYPPARSSWPGLIIEVPEEQIVGDLTLAGEMSKKLEPYNVRLAIDNCGRTFPSLAKADELPFEQLKLDPSFVAD